MVVEMFEFDSPVKKTCTRVNMFDTPVKVNDFEMVSACDYIDIGGNDDSFVLEMGVNDGDLSPNVDIFIKLKQLHESLVINTVQFKLFDLYKCCIDKQ
jgi:hypothetical protein